MPAYPTHQPGTRRLRTLSGNVAVLMVGASLCLFTAASTAGAQEAGSTSSTNLADLNIEQLMEISVEKVFTASRREQKAWEAPASVSIVTRDEIKSFGHRSLADVLKISARVYNLFDERYAITGSEEHVQRLLPQNGRSLRIKLTYKI